MNITQRHQSIIQMLQEKSQVGIQALSEYLNVSGVTIRKDLKVLEERNLLFRIKGGGSIDNPYASEKPINEKEFINVEQKKKIARMALQLTENTDSIVIGSGTTVYELSRCLYPTKHLTVITPALKVSLELYNRPNVEVIQLGGLIHQSSASAAGAFAEQILEHLSFDILFLGVDGIDLDFGLSITNLNEATLNKKMINHARKVVILADGSKFGRRGLGKICGLDQIQCIITDNSVSGATVKLVEDRGVRVMVSS